MVGLCKSDYRVARGIVGSYNYYDYNFSVMRFYRQKQVFIELIEKILNL